MSSDPNEWSTFRFTKPRESTPTDKAPADESSQHRHARKEEQDEELKVTSGDDDLLEAWTPASGDSREPIDSRATSATNSATEADPNLLAMAVSVSRSLAKFAAAGFRPASSNVHAARMDQCGACQYLEGTRCTLCGCFADKKAWMPHEDCPIGRWPV
jgi:hypothetical protein